MCPLPTLRNATLSPEPPSAQQLLADVTRATALHTSYRAASLTSAEASPFRRCLLWTHTTTTPTSTLFSLTAALRHGDPMAPASPLGDRASTTPRPGDPTSALLRPGDPASQAAADLPEPKNERIERGGAGFLTGVAGGSDTSQHVVIGSAITTPIAREWHCEQSAAGEWGSPQ